MATEKVTHVGGLPSLSEGYRWYMDNQNGTYVLKLQQVSPPHTAHLYWYDRQAKKICDAEMDTDSYLALVCSAAQRLYFKEFGSPEMPTGVLG